MKKTHFVLILFLAIVAGAAGGFAATHFLPQILPQTVPLQQDILVANEFRLVDKEGQVLALMTLENGGPALSFRTKDDKTRLSLGGRPGGDLAFALHHEDGHVRALFGVSSEGAPFLEMLNEDEKIIWSAP